MRNKFFAVLGVAATLTLAACSSSNETKPAATGNTSTGNSAAAVAATSSNSGNSNTNVMVDGATVAQAVDANLLNGETLDAGIQSPQVQNRLNKIRKTGDGPAGPPVDAAEVAMKLARPAPDNSTFTSYLSDAGYEIRTFRDHPQLKKVEKRTTDDGKVAIKVFLRNGKVIELPGSAIQVLSNAPAFQILDAAGIFPQAAPAQSNPKKGKQ